MTDDGVDGVLAVRLDRRRDIRQWVDVVALLPGIRHLLRVLLAEQADADVAFRSILDRHAPSVVAAGGEPYCRRCTTDEVVGWPCGDAADALAALHAKPAGE